MNPIIILRSIKSFIRTYEADLMDGLVVDGIEKEIGQITTSRFTRPRVPIFIAIISPQMQESYDASQLGSSISYAHVTGLAADNQYDVEIHVGDYASRRGDEDTGGDYEEFEADTETFWTFVARLVRLFRQYTSIPSSTGSFTIEVYGDGSIEDRVIRISDLSQRVEEGTGEAYNYLYAVIQFRIGTCAEPNPLS